LPRTEFIAFFLDVCGKKLDAEAGNFIRVLHENRRLALLPEIARLYDELRAEAESRVEAEVASAFEIGDAQLKSIAAALKKRFGRDVTLTTRIDPSLVGGVVIRAGDLVIDGSVRGQLHALATHLTR
jgi:F-type H+-transporting ATPase subunit delta